MAVVDRMVGELARDEQLAGASTDWLVRAVRRFFWTWYDEHQEDVVLQVKRFVVFTFTLRVKDLYTLFTVLFGKPEEVY